MTLLPSSGSLDLSSTASESSFIISAANIDEGDPDMCALSLSSLSIQHKISAARGAMRDIENIDVTDLVPSHSDYPKMLPSIMKRVAIE